MVMNPMVKGKNHLKQIQEYDTNTLPETNMT